MKNIKELPSDFKFLQDKFVGLQSLDERTLRTLSDIVTPSFYVPLLVSKMCSLVDSFSNTDFKSFYDFCSSVHDVRAVAHALSVCLEKAITLEDGECPF